MRILRLDIGENRKSVEMHPLMTVVSTLDDSERASLLQNLRSLARGSAVGVSGLIEDQSKLLVLDGEGTIALSHVTTVDVVVDADSEAVQEASTHALQAEIDQLQRQADIDAALVEEIRAQLDPTVKSRLARLRLELQSLIDGADPDEQRRALVQQAYEHASSFEQLLIEQPEAVAAAVEAWDRYQAFLREHQDYVSQVSNSMSQAELQIDVSRQTVAAAEAEAVPVLLNGEEESRLFELEEARGAKGWQEGSPESNELNALLNKVGVTSWTAYTMHSVSPSVAPEKLGHIEKCREALKADEQALAEVKNKINTDPIVGELERLRSEANQQALTQLGGDQLPDNVGAALGGLQQTQISPEWLEAQKELLSLLQTPGFGAPDSLDLEGAQGWSRLWLQQNDEKRGKVRDKGQVRKEILVAEQVLGRHNRAMAQMDRVEQRSTTSRTQISKIFQARKSAEARGAHHTAELLSFVRSMTEQALWESSSAIPVAVTGSLRNIDVSELMSSLELLAQRVQVVVVSDNADVVRWVEIAGPERALVSNPSDEQIGSS